VGRRRFPLFRLGLLLVVGAVAYAAAKFYVDFGRAFAAMSGDAPPATAREAQSEFVRQYLLGNAGSVALLIGGGVLMVLGVARLALAIGGRVTPARSSGGRAGRAASSGSGRSRGRGTP
jgi:hypothetical protein